MVNSTEAVLFDVDEFDVKRLAASAALYDIDAVRPEPGLRDDQQQRTGSG
jgi:hypothetical protein